MRVAPSNALDKGNVRGTRSLGPVRGRATPMVRVVTRDQLNARAHVRRYVESTTITAHQAHGPDPLLHGIRDAADECPHGALPNDRILRCDCWQPDRTIGTESPVSTGGFLPPNGTMN